MKVVAVNAESGAEIWKFDPSGGAARARVSSSRRAVHQDRVFVTYRNFLFALDKKTAADRVVRRERTHRSARRPRQTGRGLSVSASTPGVVFEDLLILPAAFRKRCRNAGPHRAFDISTGKQRWMFHTIPQPGEFGYDTWPKDAYQLSGGANAWAGVTVDQKTGMVFAATGSASFDFFGVTRHGDNLFANCVLALDARTGKRIWHFQGLKHDVWDWDFPAPPSLVTVTRNGQSIDAVAQVTKFGDVFVLDRRTGAPLFPIEFRKAPPSSIDGEKLAEAQPYPTKPPPFARQGLTEAMLTTRTPEAHAAVLERIPENEIGIPDAAVVRGHDRVSRLRWRRGVGRRGVRSRIRVAVRQFERDAVDHQVDPEQRHVALQLEVRDLSSRGPHWFAGGAVARERRPEADARRDRDDHPAGHRPHAGVSGHGRAQHQRRRGVPDHRQGQGQRSGELKDPTL
jgi:hypothetical protein